MYHMLQFPSFNDSNFSFHSLKKITVFRLAAGKVQEAELKRIKEMERNAEQRVMEMKRLDELSRQRRLEQLSKTEETVFRNLRYYLLVFC